MSLCVSFSSSVNPYFNLAMEEFFLTHSPPPAGSARLVFYENRPSVILGRSLKKAQEVFEHKRLPPVIRRGSGGGSVVHFYGNLNYGLILNIADFPEMQDVAISYEKILGGVRSALGPRVEAAGLSDIAAYQSGGLRKVSGNAQLRKKKRLLHHGTILYCLDDFSYINYWLRSPLVQPDYRKKRDHQSFLVRSAPVGGRPVLIRKVALELGALLGFSIVRRDLDSEERRGIRKMMQNYIFRSGL